jgi:hypothetical protein
MASEADMKAAASCVSNQDVFRAMVDLEIASTFAFQGSRWLADMAPHLLTPEQVVGVALAKEKALERRRLEALIPKHLLYVKGAPESLPTPAEARLIAGVRLAMGQLLGIEPLHTDADSVMARYRECMGGASANDEDLEDAESSVPEAMRERACG